MQIEQINVGTMNTILHDILCALIWFVPPQGMQQQVVRGAQSEANRRGKKTLATYFQDEIDRTFALNKKPSYIETLVDQMKEDFSNNAGGNDITPNRLIMFNGGKKFYREVAMQNEAYWLTGYKQGEGIDPMQLVTREMTYCESFDVKQGDFNANHDPFDEIATIGGFAYVNRSLYADQINDKIPYDNKVLDIMALNGDENIIKKISYIRALAFSGAWQGFQKSIDSGIAQSELSDIGRSVFPGCSTYKEAMLFKNNRPAYNRQLKQICGNERLMKDISRLRAVPAVDRGYVPSSISLHNEVKMEDDGDEYEDISASRDQLAQMVADSSTSSRGKRRYAEGSNQYLKRSKTSAKHKSHDEEETTTTSLSSILSKYLQLQPRESKELLARYKRFQKDHKVKGHDFDEAIVAWKVLSDRILSLQLLECAEELSKQNPNRFPSSALERSAVKRGTWNNLDHDTAQLLSDDDSKSLRWNTVSPVSVYLDPQLSVVAELYQGSTPLTLSTLHSVLFYIDSKVVAQLIAKNGQVEFNHSGMSDTDLLLKNGDRRRSALQHSVNLSAAFSIVLDALSSTKDKRQIFQDKTSPAQKDFIAKLKAVIHPSGSSAKDLPVLPCQISVKAGIDAANHLVKYFYENAPKDEEIIKQCHRLSTYLDNTMTKLPAELTTGDQSSTSGRSVTFQRATTSEENELLNGLVAEVNKHTGAYAVRIDTKYQKAIKDQVISPNQPIGVSTKYDASLATDVSVYRDLYIHYTKDCSLTSADALSLIKTLIQVGNIIYLQSPTRLQGANGAQVFDQLIQDQLVAQVTTVTNPINSLREDLPRFDNPKDESIDFTAGGIIDTAIKSVIEAKKWSEHRRNNALDVLARLVDHSSFERHRQPIVVTNEGGKIKSFPTPPHFVFHERSEKTTNDIRKGLEIVKGLLVDGSINDNGMKTLVRGLAREDYSPEVSAIILQQAYHYYPHHQTQQGGLGANVPVTRMLMKESGDEGWFSPVWDLLEHTKLWASTGYLHQASESGAPIVSDDDITMLDSEEAVDNALSTFPLDDCRLYYLLWEYNVEPFIGLMYIWPWMRFIGSHAAMVRDGLIGNVMYIQPDCLLSENGQQKLIYFHMSMYFKAMVLKPRALTQAHFIYCKKYISGMGHGMWDPLDGSHVASVKDGSTDTSRDMFVIPIHIDREIQSPVISLTGIFPDWVKISQAEKETSVYECMNVLSELWGWNSQGLNPFDPDWQVRFEAGYNDNVICMQAHQQVYDLEKRVHSQIISNRGHLGRNIYDGVMDSFKGTGGPVDTKVVGTIPRVLAVY